MDESKMPVPQFTDSRIDDGTNTTHRSDLSVTVGWFGSIWVEWRNAWIHDVRFSMVGSSSYGNPDSGEWNRDDNIYMQYYDITANSNASIHTSSNSSFIAVYPENGSDGEDYSQAIGSLLIAAIGALNTPIGLTLSATQLAIELSEYFDSSDYQMNYSIQECVLGGLYCWDILQNEISHARSFLVQTPGDGTGWGNTESVTVKSGVELQLKGGYDRTPLGVEFTFGLAGENPEYIYQNYRNDMDSFHGPHRLQARTPVTDVRPDGIPLKEIPQNPNSMSQQEKEQLGVSEVTSTPRGLKRHFGISEKEEINYWATNLPLVVKRTDRNSSGDLGRERNGDPGEYNTLI